MLCITALLTTGHSRIDHHDKATVCVSLHSLYAILSLSAPCCINTCTSLFQPANKSVNPSVYSVQDICKNARLQMAADYYMIKNPVGVHSLYLCTIYLCSSLPIFLLLMWVNCSQLHRSVIQRSVRPVTVVSTGTFELKPQLKRLYYLIRAKKYHC